MSEVLIECPIDLNGLLTKINLNDLPLRFYDSLIGMDWLEKHRAKVYFYENVFECVDEEERPRLIKGIPKKVSVRRILALKLRNFYKQGCQLYAAHILDYLEDKGPKIEYYPFLQNFRDVFPNEVSRLPPKRDIDFTIDIVPGAVPVSKAPYRMSTPKLVELKMKLHELMDKKYIRPSVSPWGETMLFVKKKDGALRL